MRKVFLISMLSAALGSILGVGFYHFGHINTAVAEETFKDSVDSPRRQITYNSNKINTNYPDFASTAAQVIPTVVHIKTTYMVNNDRAAEGLYVDPFFEDFFNEFFGQRTPKNRRGTPEKNFAAGSGALISSDGYIVTNNHVVARADEIEVVLSDKRSFTAKVVGTDPDTDLALIKIDASNLPYLRFGDSDKAQIGEWVMAVGNPLNLTSTVTAGIISAKARNIGILRSNSPNSTNGASAAIESFLQTDAVINRGNSGGPLVNIEGDLIGINAAIASQTGFYEGYGFAIPSNLVKKITSDLKETGRVRRAVLGITFIENNADFAKEKQLPTVLGVYVQEVMDGSAAYKAGIRAGDIITKINDKTIKESAVLQETIARHLPGQKVKLSVLHKGSEKNLWITLADASEFKRATAKQKIASIESLGANFAELSLKEKKQYALKSGLKIVALNPAGLLAKNEFEKGFIIESVNNRFVNTTKDLERALALSTNGLVKIQGYSPQDSLRFRIVFPLK